MVPSPGRIEARQQSRWFRFTDDIVLRVAGDEVGSRIDMRSTSRQGRSDYGVNAARIRAFFVHPDFARRGLGTLLLDACESAARERGFRAAELMATLPGERLYSVRGSLPLEPVRHPLPGGLTIDFVRMRKGLV